MKRNAVRILCLALAILMTLSLTACGGKGTVAAPPADNGDNVVKVGYIGNMSWATGLDTVNTMKIKTEIVNEAGGIDVGGTKYKVELITYDSNNDQATMTAAANRLIFEDGVKYICTDGTLVDSIIPITEENHVLLCTSALSNEIFSTDYHYSFQTCANNSGIATTYSWMANAYPEKKTLTVAYADNEMGNMAMFIFGPSIKHAGLEADFQSYPDSTADLSALGTKIKSTNPDWFLAVGGNMQPYAAVYNAGYEGQMYYPTAASTASILQELSVEQAEGLIAQADPLEFDEPPTTAGVELKNAWIEKNGEWTYPSVSFATSYYCILQAIDEADSLDPEELAAFLDKGFEWDAPSGLYRLVPRPDLGNDRCVDSVQTIYMKQIVDGKAVLLDTVTLDQCQQYFLDSLNEESGSGDPS